MLFDRRLLHQGQHGKWLLILAGISAFAGGVLALIQARTFSQIIARTFLERQPLEVVAALLFWFAGFLVLRACLVVGQDFSAARAAFQIKLAIREQLVEHLKRVPHLNRDTESSGEVSQVAIEAVEALEPYFAQYLPQAVVAFFVPPILCLAVFLIDPLSGVVFLVTAPLIPFFMRLIGDVSERQTRRQWGRLSQLSAFLFDALQGLETIKRVGKSEPMAQQLAQKGDEYRQATLQTLKTTFLSAFVLETLTTLSTAVVAVQVGLRLLYGWIPFEQALFVLVLAPEFYLPLRLLGQRFHAGMSGLTAWKRICNLLDLPAIEETRSPDSEGIDEDEPECDIEWQKGITLQTVSFAYPNRWGILEKVTASFKTGEITILVGASGVGKTTLLNLILGILQPDEGQILVGDKPIENIPLELWWRQIGYAPQMPFLFQGTVGENIAFAKKNASLEEVQAAAKLACADQFIQDLPQGYDTHLGENGYGLSAGEKQRLVLARVFLKNAPLLILDESTANIDPHTLENILINLREYAKGRTILIASHQPQVWEIGDRFWVLRDGEVLDLDRDSFERMYTQGEFDFSAIEADVLSQNLISEDRVITGAAIVEELSHSIGNREAYAPIQPLSANVGIWKKWLQQMWSLRAWVALAVFLGWAAIMSNVGLMSTSAYIISFAALQPSIALLQTAIVGVRFFGISRGLFRYLERLASHRVTLDLLARMRVWFYRALERRVPLVLYRFGSGELLSRLIGDIASLEPFYVRAIAPMLIAAFIAAAILVWMLTYDLSLVLTILCCYLMAAFIVLPIFYLLTQKMTSPNNALRGQYNERFILFLQGLSELNINRRINEFQRRLNTSARRYGQGIFQFNALMSLQAGWMTLLAYLAMWMALWVAIPMVHEQTLSGLSLAGIGLGVLVSFEAFLLLPQAVQQFVVGKNALSRLAELVEPESETNPLPTSAFRSIERFEIRVERLSFTYFHSKKEGNHLSQNGIQETAGIKNINFTLHEGKKLGIVGRSGGGKTTLLNLLLGMLQPQSGQIVLDGKALGDYDLAWWRSYVASCSQNDYLFQTTLRQNLLFLNPGADENRLWKALEAVKLADTVRSLPEGLETNLGEHGKQLSGGERQRVLIARTLLRDSPLYIFDEPTANLDPVTGLEVVRNILDWTDGRALIIVSHQAIGFEQMDEILVIERGEVFQRGKHRELLEEGGYYAKLWGKTELG